MSENKDDNDKVWERGGRRSPQNFPHNSNEMFKKISNNARSDQIITIDIDKVFPDPDQPRKYFDSLHLDNLKHSIETLSQIEAILVRVNDRKSGTYLIVDGERRWRALKELEYKQIKCRVITIDSDDYEIVSLTQNIHREDLLPIEKALALAKLLKKMKGDNEKVLQRQLIQKVNLSENYISELLKISTLEDPIKKEALKSNYWSGAKLLYLAKIKDPTQRKEKFEEFKAKIQRKIDKDNKVGFDTQDPDELLKPKKLTKYDVSVMQKRLVVLTKTLDKIRYENMDITELESIKPNFDQLATVMKVIFDGKK
ncbi:MAG: ParB/RepB/Spo0J family partition protein [Deltaproteobacteria bacterium]|jgi:ParB family chromosome partitioning protein|nr:ParB/RepB/Spo0J family partition protein [Deltaproteobacteria bacterium]